MSLIVIGMAVTIFAVQGALLTSSLVVFTLVMLVPSVLVDVTMMFGPRPGSGDAPPSGRAPGRRAGRRPHL